MKVVLPDNTKIYLPGNNTYDERLQIVEDVLARCGNYYVETWDLQRTRTTLDILATYLSRAKEFRTENPSPVLSRRKQRDLDRGTDKCIPFSHLSNTWKIMFGLIDGDEVQ